MHHYIDNPCRIADGEGDLRHCGQQKCKQIFIPGMDGMEALDDPIGVQRSWIAIGVERHHWYRHLDQDGNVLCDASVGLEAKPKLCG